VLGDCRYGIEGVLANRSALGASGPLVYYREKGKRISRTIRWDVGKRKMRRRGNG
jgi:hypothetical protein